MTMDLKSLRAIAEAVLNPIEPDGAFVIKLRPEAKFQDTFTPKLVLELLDRLEFTEQQLDKFHIFGSDGCLNCETGRITLFSKCNWCLECLRKKEASMPPE